MALLPPNGPYCNGCVLSRSGRGFMQVDGLGHSGVMLVGEALGYHEALNNQPFVGPAGQILRKVLKRHVKLTRDDFYIANVLFCQPPNNELQGMSYKYAAMNQCAPNLDDAIHQLKPRALVALGDIPMERLLGMRGIKARQNYAFRSPTHGIWVVPALHPSFIQRGNHKYQPILGHAIRKAVAIAAAEGTDQAYAYEKPDVIGDASYGQFETWLDEYLAALAANPALVLAFDIETNFKGAKDESKLKEDVDPTFDIIQISFAYERSRGIAIPWNEQFKPLIARALGTEGVKIVWNRNYDVPRIRANGVAINGTIRDSMIAWHALNSDMDKGLGFVTPLIPGNERLPFWKDQSDENGGWWYSGLDSIALWRNDVGIMDGLKREGILPFYHKYVEGVRPVLDDMEAAGMLLDPEAQANFIVDTEDEMLALEHDMQQLVPDELKPIHPKEGYKKDPKPEVLAAGTYRHVAVPNQEWTECPACGLKNPTKAHFKDYKSAKHAHKNTICSGLQPQPLKGTAYRWAKVLPFKPSPQQLIAYAKHKGYKLRTNYKTGNLTMDEETLTRLLKKHGGDLLFPKVLEHRGVQKLYGLYGPDGLTLGPDGRIHTHFGDNPSTFRFNSYGPNMQNIPRGSTIRGLFIAGPGCILGARDFSGIEAVLVGYFAHDRDYVRLAKMGVHDYFNAHLCHDRGELLAADLPDLRWSDEDLRSYLGQLKDQLRATRPVAKVGVHMSNYLGSPLRLYQSAPDLFDGVRGAEHVQGLYLDVFPSIKKWQHDVCVSTDRIGYIRSPFGLPHRFYQVYTYVRDKETQEWTKVLGEDAKRAVAFNPQHTAAGIMRRSLYDLRDSWVREFLRLTIHDELLWEVPEEKADAVDEEIRLVMEQPNKELPLPAEWGMGSHLSIGTEAMRAHRWGDMKA